MAHASTLRNFGRTIQLYTPLYLSDYCDNRCVYCSFSAQHGFERRQLRPEEVDREGAAIAASGLRHILILTGESRSMSPVSYIRGCGEILKRHFHDISVEVYPLTQPEYAELVESGIDGLTLFQETYDEAAYERLHPAGPKRNFRFRLEAPERGGLAHMRNITIGALLGLADWRRDAFFTGLHARHLMEQFPDADIGVAVPRLRPYKGHFTGPCRVTDRNLVQVVLALRLFLPHLKISLSTREDGAFRENLLPLGITSMSAGSVTSVGGHAQGSCNDDAAPQFNIADDRSIGEITAMIREKGYDPVLSNWIPHTMPIASGSAL